MLLCLLHLSSKKQMLVDESTSLAISCILVNVHLIGTRMSLSTNMALFEYAFSHGGDPLHKATTKKGNVENGH